MIIGARELDGKGAALAWVTDNGAGIEPDLLAKVFEKGETDPASGGGLGLGLAIVKTFIEAHGGKVTAESKVGAGSTFRLSLPARSAPPHQAPYPRGNGSQAAETPSSAGPEELRKTRRASA